jgi:hypothetical protein
VRLRFLGERKRYDLEQAVEGDLDVGGLSIKSARALASQLFEMARKGQNPAIYLAARARGITGKPI